MIYLLNGFNLTENVSVFSNKLRRTLLYLGPSNLSKIGNIYKNVFYLTKRGQVTGNDRHLRIELDPSSFEKFVPNSAVNILFSLNELLPSPSAKIFDLELSSYRLKITHM